MLTFLALLALQAVVPTEARTARSRSKARSSLRAPAVHSAGGLSVDKEQAFLAPNPSGFSYDWASFVPSSFLPSPGISGSYSASGPAPAPSVGGQVPAPSTIPSGIQPLVTSPKEGDSAPPAPSTPTARPTLPCPPTAPPTTTKPPAPSPAGIDCEITRILNATLANSAGPVYEDGLYNLAMSHIGGDMLPKCSMDHCDDVCKRVVTQPIPEAMVDCKKTCRGMTRRCCTYCMYSSYWSPQAEVDGQSDQASKPFDDCMPRCPKNVVLQLENKPPVYDLVAPLMLNQSNVSNQTNESAVPMYHFPDRQPMPGYFPMAFPYPGSKAVASATDPLQKKLEKRIVKVTREDAITRYARYLDRLHPAEMGNFQNASAGLHQGSDEWMKGSSQFMEPPIHSSDLVEPPLPRLVSAVRLPTSNKSVGDFTWERLPTPHVADVDVAVNLPAQPSHATPADCSVCPKAAWAKGCTSYCKAVYEECVTLCDVTWSAETWSDETDVGSREGCYKRCSVHVEAVLKERIQTGLSQPTPTFLLPAIVNATSMILPDSVGPVPCHTPPQPRPMPQQLKATLGVYPRRQDLFEGQIMIPSPAPEEEPFTRLGPMAPASFPPAPAPAPMPMVSNQSQSLQTSITTTTTTGLTLITLESVGQKQSYSDATDFGEFTIALQAPNVPRIGIIELDLVTTSTTTASPQIPAAINTAAATATTTTSATTTITTAADTTADSTDTSDTTAADTAGTTTSATTTITTTTTAADTTAADTTADTTDTSDTTAADADPPAPSADTTSTTADTTTAGTTETVSSALFFLQEPSLELRGTDRRITLVLYIADSYPADLNEMYYSAFTDLRENHLPANVQAVVARSVADLTYDNIYYGGSTAVNEFPRLASLGNLPSPGPAPIPAMAYGPAPNIAPSPQSMNIFAPSPFPIIMAPRAASPWPQPPPPAPPPPSPQPLSPPSQQPPQQPQPISTLEDLEEKENEEDGESPLAFLQESEKSDEEEQSQAAAALLRKRGRRKTSFTFSPTQEVMQTWQNFYNNGAYGWMILKLSNVNGSDASSSSASQSNATNATPVFPLAGLNLSNMTAAAAAAAAAAYAAGNYSNYSSLAPAPAQTLAASPGFGPGTKVAAAVRAAMPGPGPMPMPMPAPGPAPLPGGMLPGGVAAPMPTPAPAPAPGPLYAQAQGQAKQGQAPAAASAGGDSATPVPSPATANATNATNASGSQTAAATSGATPGATGSATATAPAPGTQTQDGVTSSTTQGTSGTSGTATQGSAGTAGGTSTTVAPGTSGTGTQGATGAAGTAGATTGTGSGSGTAGTSGGATAGAGAGASAGAGAGASAGSGTGTAAGTGAATGAGAAGTGGSATTPGASTGGTGTGTSGTAGTGASGTVPGSTGTGTGTGSTGTADGSAVTIAATTITTTTITFTTTTRVNDEVLNVLPTVPPMQGMPTTTTTTTTPNCVVDERVAIGDGCQQYNLCIAKNGTFKKVSCAAGTAFDTTSQICTDPQNVAGCEDYAPDCLTGNTGGTCTLSYSGESNCGKWRGDTSCINGICHCKAGQCAIPEDSPGLQKGTCIEGLESFAPSLNPETGDCLKDTTEASCSASSPCEDWRGPTECKNGECVCQEGSCSSEDGRCLHKQ